MTYRRSGWDFNLYAGRISHLVHHEPDPVTGFNFYSVWAQIADGWLGVGCMFWPRVTWVTPLAGAAQRNYDMDGPNDLTIDEAIAREIVRIGDRMTDAEARLANTKRFGRVGIARHTTTGFFDGPLDLSDRDDLLDNLVRTTFDESWLPYAWPPGVDQETVHRFWEKGLDTYEDQELLARLSVDHPWIGREFTKWRNYTGTDDWGYRNG